MKVNLLNILKSCFEKKKSRGKNYKIDVDVCSLSFDGNFLHTMQIICVVRTVALVDRRLRYFLLRITRIVTWKWFEVVVPGGETSSLFFKCIIINDKYVF